MTIQSNQSTDIIWANVLEKTNTQLWRQTSSKFAWHLWCALDVIENGNKKDRIQRWKDQSDSFRIYARHCLRSLLKEGIKIDYYPSSLLSKTDNDWKVKTNRVARVLWLAKLTPSERSSENLKISKWETEAGEFRKVIRRLLTDMAKEGIGIVK